jgi:hypothetical protein
MMAGAGILGEYKGSQAREVLMTLKDYEKLRERMEAEAAAAAATEDTTGEDEDSSGPNYVSEGQRGYAAVDNDAE